jgi:hypothetical protein
MRHVLVKKFRKKGEDGKKQKRENGWMDGSKERKKVNK